MLKIILPIPSSDLAVNKSKGQHWSKSYAKRKKARESGYWLALEALQTYEGIFAPTMKLKLTIVAYFKDGRKLDDDNFLSACKHVRDGIFDSLKAKFGLNDNQVCMQILDTTGRDKINPRVECFLEELKND